MVLLRTPQKTFRATVGTTELGTVEPPTTSNHFRIATNTKTMTAALILLLAQDGRLRPSDPASAYVPGVPDGEHIAIADLLKTRSGLYNYTEAPELASRMDADPRKAVTRQQMSAIAFRCPPNSVPDAPYQYSKTNYALRGLAAERADGHPPAQRFRGRCQVEWRPSRAARSPVWSNRWKGCPWGRRRTGVSASRRRSSPPACGRTTAST
ncbi:serine hydrolase domain-containing protein [Streptomyces sp. TE5632]